MKLRIVFKSRPMLMLELKYDVHEPRHVLTRLHVPLGQRTIYNVLNFARFHRLPKAYNGGIPMQPSIYFSLTPTFWLANELWRRLINESNLVRDQRSSVHE